MPLWLHGNACWLGILLYHPEKAGHVQENKRVTVEEKGTVWEDPVTDLLCR